MNTDDAPPPQQPTHPPPDQSGVAATLSSAFSSAVSSALSSLAKSFHGPTTPKDASRSEVHPWPGYAAGLFVLAPWMPVLAWALTLAMYLGVPSTHRLAVLIGGGGGVALWLLGAFLCRDFARPGYTSPTSYQMLLTQLALIAARIDALPSTGEKQADITEALAEAMNSKQRLQALIERTGVHWVVGSGYTAAWTLIDRIEEALMMAESKSAVLRDALYDKSRLEDSTVDGRDHLLAKLRMSAVTIIPEAASSFDMVGEQNSAVKPAHESKHDEEVARVRLRDVKRKINEFRAERWEGLLRARNRLVIAMLITELLLGALLGLALVTDAPPASVAGAAAVFLVGATVGLFNRVYAESRESRQNSTVDDYGLSVARWLLTPLLSGLGALGGVLLMLMLYGAFIGQYIQPPQGSTPPISATVTVAAQLHAAPLPVLQTGSDTASTNTQSSELDARDIAQIYNLGTDPYALLLAAIFGIAPASLVSMLQQQATRYTSDLKSSEASTGSRNVGG